MISVFRFSFIALLLLLAELALFGVVGDWILGLIAAGKLGLAGTVRLPLHLGMMVLEAAGLLALYSLAQGRCLSRWIDGLVAAWLAWIFRGPIVVLTLAAIPGQPREAWLWVALVWWVVYTICGLSLAWLDGRLAAGETDDLGEASTGDQSLI